MCGYVAASDARTSFSAPYRRAANKDSTASASIPLMITLRHILTAEATPMRSLMGVAFMPIDLRRAATVSASAPPSSIGTFRRCGETGAITAASTTLAFDGSRIRAISRFVFGETELMSRYVCPPLRAEAASFAAPAAAEAVTAEITRSAPRIASSKLSHARTFAFEALASIGARDGSARRRTSNIATLTPAAARSRPKIPPNSPKPIKATCRTGIPLMTTPSFSNSQFNTACWVVGASDGISDRNPCEQDLFCTDKITSTTRVTSNRLQAVTRRLAPGQTHGRVVNADFAVPPSPEMGLQGQLEPQVLYLQSDSTTAVPYQIWYNRVENKLGGNQSPPNGV